MVGWQPRRTPAFSSYERQAGSDISQFRSQSAAWALRSLSACAAARTRSLYASVARITCSHTTKLRSKALRVIIRSGREVFDLIFDTVGIDKTWTVLAPRLLERNGRFVAAALPQLADGRAGEDIGVVGGLAAVGRFVLRRMGGRYRFIYGFMGDVFCKRSFASLVQWIAEEKMAARLAATYSLDQLAGAHRASETGRTVGKISVVIP